MTTSNPKQATLDLISRLDEDASFEEIQYRIHVLQKISEGLTQVERGETVSHAEVRERLRSWLDEPPLPEGGKRG